MIKKKSPILINNIKKKELNNEVYLSKTIDESFREVVTTMYSIDDFLKENINEIIKKSKNVNKLEQFISKNFY